MLRGQMHSANGGLEGYALVSPDLVVSHPMMVLE